MKPGPKKRHLTKAIMAECWKLQGMWEEALHFRERRKIEMQGQKIAHVVAVRKAWEETLLLYPIKQETVEEYHRLKRLTPEMKVERREQIRQEVEAEGMRSVKVENATGVPLFDWVFAHLKGEIPPEPTKGFLDFLREARKDPGEFYRKFYLPALMKKQGIRDKPVEQDEGQQPEASERSTENLLKTIREAAKG